MEARNRTIEEWFGWIRDGHVVLPRFQRYEAWISGQGEVFESFALAALTERIRASARRNAPAPAEGSSEGGVMRVDPDDVERA